MFSPLILVIVCVSEGVVSETATLITEKVDVLENSSVALTCIIRDSVISTITWKNSDDQKVWASMSRSDDYGLCDVGGFLSENSYMSKCYKNNSFELTLLKVDGKQNDQAWQCRVGIDGLSNEVTINVKVPVKTVNISTASYGVIRLEENKYHIFICETSYSRPKPFVKWFLHAENITYPINAVSRDVLNQNDNGLESAKDILNISFSRDNNGDELYCTGSNNISEEIRSRKITLNINYAPNGGPIIHGIENGSEYAIREHTVGNLSCSISLGNPLPQLSWNCSGKPFNSTADSKIVQLPLQWDTKRDTDKICVCTSKHTIAGIQTSLVKIKILYPPIINTIILWFNAEHQHANVSMHEVIRVKENESISLQCEAASKPESSYHWSGEKTSNSSILAFENLSTRKSFNITCHARNVMVFNHGGRSETGNSSRSVTVDVLYAPDIGQLNDLSAIEGIDVTITCPFKHGNPTETTITWARELDELQWDGEDLTIQNISRNDSMVYTCTVNNTMIMTGGIAEIGEKSGNISVDVMYPPNKPKIFLLSISEKDVNISVNGVFSVVENTSFSLLCESSSHPSPTVYVWTGLGTFNNSVLRILGVSRNDRDKVTCRVSNNMIPTYGLPQTGNNNNTISMNVLYPPVIDPMKDISVAEGSRAKLSCPVTHGNPNNTVITWTSENGDRHWSRPVFTLQNVSRNESMVYTCTVKNTMVMTGGIVKKGNDSRNVHLDVMCMYENISVYDFTIRLIYKPFNL